MPLPEIRLTAGAIAAAVGGTVAAGDPNRPADRFSIDSRTLAPGDVFVAIRGERFDGEDFVGAALAAGAAGVLSTRPDVAVAARRTTAFAIVVADTTEALQRLAREVRRTSGARVVAITGSAGKTTTKEAAAEFLSARYRVFRNRGNFNNHIGLPLSLLELRHRPDLAVVELGMSHPGEIRTLTAIAEPDVRVWTNVGAAHLEFFASIDAIADAKAEILEGAVAESVLVANADDQRIVARLSRFAGRVVTFGMDRVADVRATNVHDLGIDGIEADLRTPVGDARLRTRLIGRGSLANVLAATAVALHFEIPLGDILQRAEALAAAPGRGRVAKLKGGVTLIDDSYNSNPQAAEQVLAVLAGDDRHRRRIAVLGEMLELGSHATELHEAIGRVAARSRLALLVGIGGRSAEAMTLAARAAGMPASAVLYAARSDEAAGPIVARLEPGDLVLVKGSRGIRTERVVERIESELG